MTVTELLGRLRRLADENGELARGWAVKGHPHLSSYYQGQREAYLKAIRLVEGDGEPAPVSGDRVCDRGDRT